MDDLISRQDAIETIRKLPNAGIHWFVSTEAVFDALLKLPPVQPDNQVHLCDSCRYVYPECPSEKDDVIFGNGKGNDNVCACNKYEPSVQPEIIMCKNCKYYREFKYDEVLACHYVIGATVRRKPEDFCSRAERRTDG